MASMRNGFFLALAITFASPALHAANSSYCPPVDPYGAYVSIPPRGYDSFYAKMVYAPGIPIVASAQTCDRSLQVAYEIVSKMLSLRPDIEQQMIRNGAYVAIFSIHEKLTDIPENRDLAGRPVPGEPQITWDSVCGSGAMRDRPMTICERNLIGIADPYGGRMSIMIHEFGHTVQDLGLDAGMKRRIKTAYNNAVASGLFPPSPGRGVPWIMNNDQEFFACGTANWFNATDPSNPYGSPAQNGKVYLKSYAPELYQILSEIYPDDHWRYPRR